MAAIAQAKQPSRKRRGNIWNALTNNEKVIGILFVLPSLIGFTVFFAIPALRSVVISFYEWNLLSDAKFVGMGNYEQIFADTRFWGALGTTVVYVLWNIPLQTVLAVFLAVMLDRIQQSTWLRGLFILPWLVPNVVAAMLFLWILDPSLGIMNSFLNLLGIPDQPWLRAPEQAIQSIAGINIWRHTGYNAILIFAGLKTIPRMLYEAAEIDGATGPTRFFRITLPLLRPVLVFVLVTSVIGSFQVFDTIAVTTDGGPAGSTRTIIYYIYEQVFERAIRMGPATAASVVLFIILITVTIIQMRYLRANRSDLADYS
jgi:multiple sugar transport system permease protein